MDVPLSPLGIRQAEALGAWFARGGFKPDVVFSSPYARARQTADIATGVMKTPKPVFDERLREREFGVLDRLTAAGIQQFYPDQAELRAAVGKFYYRPPAGESWCDVLLRLRAALAAICLHHAGQQVVIFTHEVVVFCFRYLLEGLDEAAILAIDKAGDVANCAVTEYVREGNALNLVRYNVTAPLEEAHTPVTAEPPNRPSGA